MKLLKLFSMLSLLLTVFSAQSCGQAPELTKGKGEYGAKISTKDAIEATQIPEKLQNIDSMWVRVKGDVVAVCQNKGCWMTLDIGSGKTMRVRFKDYGFFVPKNCAGSEATMEGWAYRKTISVAEQQHYALDGGKSQAEIDSITQPSTEFIYYADGVILIKK